MTAFWGAVLGMRWFSALAWGAGGGRVHGAVRFGIVLRPGGGRHKDRGKTDHSSLLPAPATVLQLVCTGMAYLTYNYTKLVPQQIDSHTRC